MSDGVGNIEVLGRYPDFATGSKAAVAIAADPDSIALLAEREKIQSSILQGPYVYEMSLVRSLVSPLCCFASIKLAVKT